MISLPQRCGGDTLPARMPGEPIASFGALLAPFVFVGFGSPPWASARRR